MLLTNLNVLLEGVLSESLKYWSWLGSYSLAEGFLRRYVLRAEGLIQIVIVHDFDWAVVSLLVTIWLDIVLWVDELLD
jgi:hypothetical protein